jgi:hypothetical protein
MADSIIRLPPVIVRSARIDLVQDALKHLLGVECVKECSFEEQNIAYIKFLPLNRNTCIEFYNKLSGQIQFTYNDYVYIVDSQYLNL